MTAISHQQLINNILSLPDAIFVLNKINTQLENERKKREAFYNDITEYEKTEFINGEIIIHSPVKKEHNDALGRLYKLVDTFVNSKDLGYVGIEKIMITLTRNDYEPDLCFFNKEKAASFQKGQSLFPAPDLVVEVLSKRTASNDRKIKFKDYQAHGVQEYWMIEPSEEWVEQYRLNEVGQYNLILKTKQGTIKCQAIQGFEIAIESIFNKDRNLEELRRILLDT